MAGSLRKLKMPDDIVLASTSPIRAHLLQSAGVSFTIEPPCVDEDNFKEKLILANATPLDIAEQLAIQKALSVKAPAQTYVLGADQILSFKGEIYNKPKTREEAEENLRVLRGETHYLETALCVVQRGISVYSIKERARLVMRNFSNNFLNHYLEKNCPDILSSVGAYQLESEGIQLFSEIEGDYFTILGMPMLKLLSFLQERGALEK